MNPTPRTPDKSPSRAQARAKAAAAADASVAADFAAGLRTGIRGLGGMARIRDNLDDLTETRQAHRAMMNRLGLGGLLVDKEHGGLGSSMAVAVALGRVAGEVPAADFVGPYVQAPIMLGIIQDGHPKESVRALAAHTLADMAAGRTCVSTAGGGLVIDAVDCASIVVFQNDAIHLVSTADVDLTEVPAFDPTRTIHRVDEVSVLGAGEILATDDHAAEITGAGLVAGRVYLAAELEGTARTVLNETVEYLRHRMQFGRPLGSFQALKHQLADMWSEVSLIGPLVDQAAWQLDHGEDFAEAAIYAAAALSFAADTATSVCEQALQLHGGIGYTWESPLHIWLKRTAANRVLLGTPHALRAELASLTDI